MTSAATNGGKVIYAADLFCGAGGTSTGLIKAVNSLGYESSLIAINHWDTAILTHSKNHRQVKHLCQNIDKVDPRELVPSGRLDLLCASPECTDHSNAKGGKPRSDQKRADAFLLLRWINSIYIENILIENVKEFKDWGPLGANGLPLKSKRGEYFRQFISFLEVNYRVEWRILNAANYGDATTRERFMLIARRPKHKAISWPEQTHAKKPVKLAGGRTLKPWRTAREIIDWQLEGESIFNRKKPLSKNTLARIFTGLGKYSGLPFVLPHQHGSSGVNNVRPADAPLPTITGTSSDMFLAQPYLLNLKGSARRDRSIDEPTFTQCGARHQYLIEPFFFNIAHNNGTDNHGSYCYDLKRPLPTVAGKGMFGLVECEPVKLSEYMVQFFGERAGQKPRTRDVNEPCWTITAQGRMAVCQPELIPLNEYLVKYYGGATACSVDAPVPALTANYEHYALARPELIPFPGQAQDGADGKGLTEPTLIKFTLDGRERFGLFIPQLGAILDIKFRMLQPHELAAAHSFPRNYFFAGNRDDKVKQIGNSVPVELARALVRAILTTDARMKAAKLKLAA